MMHSREWELSRKLTSGSRGGRGNCRLTLCHYMNWIRDFTITIHSPTPNLVFGNSVGLFAGFHTIMYILYRYNPLLESEIYTSITFQTAHKQEK